MSETTEISGPLVKALLKAGAWVERMNSGKIRLKGRVMHLHPKGTADLMVFPRGGGVVWIECKSPKGHTNKEQIEAQAAFKAKAESFGHRVIRATTVAEGLQAL